MFLQTAQIMLYYNLYKNPDRKKRVFHGRGRKFSTEFNMKKKLTAILCVIFSLVMLSACSQRVLVDVDANWHTNTTLSYDDTFYEKTVYDISYEANGSATNDLVYKDITGVYTVTVEAVTNYLQPENEFTVQQAYKLTSVLEMSGSIETKKGEAICSFGKDGTAGDKITTTVWFRAEDERLEPIRTEVDLYSHSPNGNKGATLYSYTSVTAYNESCSKAKVTVTDRSEELSDLKTDTLSIGKVRAGTFNYKDLQDSYSCFDNAQIYFAGRGFTFKKNSSNTVTVLDDTAGKNDVKYSCSAVTERKDLDFTIDGASQKDKAINVCTVSIGLANAGTNTGTNKEVQYIQTGNEQNNTYRNLPVRIKEPLADLMGDMIFTLRSASYTK